MWVGAVKAGLRVCEEVVTDRTPQGAVDRKGSRSRQLYDRSVPFLKRKSEGKNLEGEDIRARASEACTHPSQDPGALSTGTRYSTKLPLHKGKVSATWTPSSKLQGGELWNEKPGAI